MKQHYFRWYLYNFNIQIEMLLFWHNCTLISLCLTALQRFYSYKKESPTYKIQWFIVPILILFYHLKKSDINLLNHKKNHKIRQCQNRNWYNNSICSEIVVRLKSSFFDTCFDVASGGCNACGQVYFTYARFAYLRSLYAANCLCSFKNLTAKHHAGNLLYNVSNDYVHRLNNFKMWYCNIVFGTANCTPFFNLYLRLNTIVKYFTALYWFDVQQNCEYDWSNLTEKLPHYLSSITFFNTTTTNITNDL